jgi:hypothetical protein
MLWEALAGRHPFRSESMSETSALIQAGAEPLERIRPDLPTFVHRAVAGALVLDPARRPSAERLADELRGRVKRRRPRRDRTRPPRAPVRVLASSALPERALPAGLAAVTAGWVGATLPFYPAGWPLGLAAVAGAVAAASPRAGLTFALATAVLGSRSSSPPSRSRGSR